MESFVGSLVLAAMVASVFAAPVFLYLLSGRVKALEAAAAEIERLRQDHDRLSKRLAAVEGEAGLLRDQKIFERLETVEAAAAANQTDTKRDLDHLTWLVNHCSEGVTLLNDHVRFQLEQVWRVLKTANPDLEPAGGPPRAASDMGALARVALTEDKREP